MSEQSPYRPDKALVAGTALLAWALFLLRYGYGFGFSDQDEFIPLAMRFVDGSLFRMDAFVAMQLEGFTIRMPMAGLVAIPSFLLPMWLVVFVLHMATGIGSGWAVAQMAHRFSDSAWVTPVATVTVLALTARWNPGGNDILHSMLVPSSVAWCALLWAFERLSNRKFLASGLLAAVGTLFHPLVGLQAGAILMAGLFLLPGTSGKEKAHTVLPWLLMAGLAVMLFSGLGSSGLGSSGLGNDAGNANLSAITILTHWRAPHHYLPSAFHWQDAVQLLVPFATALVLLARKHTSLPEWRLLSVVLVLPALVLLVSLAVTWWPLSLDAALRLQPWALSPLLRVWSVLIAVVLVAGLLPIRPESDAPRAAISPSIILLLVGGAALSLSLVRLAPDIRGAAHPDRELHAWAAENTDVNAVFVIPPSMSGFQSGAKRAQYVSFKSFPFASGPTIEWWNRLQRMAPIDNPEPGGVALQTRLDSAWAHQPVSGVRDFVETEPVDFLVRPAIDPAHWSASIKPQWCGQDWCVYWAGRILRTNPQAALK